MICASCRRQQHADCPGGTWCDCQHLPPAGAAAGSEHAAEPALNWVHQG